MDKNVLFLVNQTAVDFAKKLVEKANGYGMYDADHSVTRTFQVLINVLKRECELYEYNSFIADLLGTMLHNADDGIYKTKMNVSDIMAELPYMSVFGIQTTLMRNSSSIALFEMVNNEYNEYELEKTGLKKEDDDEEEFLLKKIDAE